MAIDRYFLQPEQENDIITKFYHRKILLKFLSFFGTETTTLKTKYFQSPVRCKKKLSFNKKWPAYWSKNLHGKKFSKKI